MLKETAANQAAWDKLAQDHYNHFRKSLKSEGKLPLVLSLTAKKLPV